MREAHQTATKMAEFEVLTDHLGVIVNDTLSIGNISNEIHDAVLNLDSSAADCLFEMLFSSRIHWPLFVGCMQNNLA